MRILQIFTSQQGQTAKIAKCIATELTASGHIVETLQLQNASQQPKLTGFDWIIIGGSIYYGKHSTLLKHFITANKPALNAVKTVFYSVNLTARKPNRNTPENNIYLRKFLAQLNWHPNKSTVFAGALEYSRYNFFDKHIIRLIMKITGGSTDLNQDLEVTDWQSVKALAKQIQDHEVINH